jgi:hypothetical protein
MSTELFGALPCFELGGRWRDVEEIDVVREIRGDGDT